MSLCMHLCVHLFAKCQHYARIYNSSKLYNYIHCNASLMVTPNIKQFATNAIFQLILLIQLRKYAVDTASLHVISATSMRSHAVLNRQCCWTRIHRGTRLGDRQYKVQLYCPILDTIIVHMVTDKSIIPPTLYPLSGKYPKTAP